MREKNQETQADIIAEMRMGSPCGPCVYRIGLPDKEEVYESGAKRRITMIKNVTVQELADRLEAAEKRKKAQHGNAAEMREALATLRKRFDNNTMAYQDRYFKFSGWHWHKKAKEAARWRDVFHELREVCDAALSAPPRQCDVGTPEEKYRRWVHFCEQRLHSCHNCECNSPEGCTFKFGDMPYIKKGGGGK